MKVLKLPVIEVTPNSYNPNKMEAGDYETLKANIKKYGMIQPILVRQDKTIIDGFHRWRASKEAGLNDVWCVMVETSDEEARIKTIAFNTLRGSNDTELLGSLLDDLTNYFSVDEIMVETGYSYDEIREAFVLNDLDMSIFEEIEKDGNKAKELFDTGDKEDKDEPRQMSVAGLFGSKLVPKDIADKILLLFEEIRKKDNNTNDIILANAVSKCKEKVRKININEYLKEVKR